MENSAKTALLQVNGMTCEGCARGAARALKKVEGVISADVSLDRAEARIAFDPSRASIAQLKAALEAAGYQAP
jgi:copper chaperone